MDEDKFMLLTNLPLTKTKSAVKKKFGLLSLAVKQEGIELVKTSQRKLYYDDDEDDSKENIQFVPDDGADKIIPIKSENRIFHSTNSVDDSRGRHSHLESTYATEIGIQLSRLEISQSQELSDDVKVQLSEPLFETEPNVKQEDVYASPIKQDESVDDTNSEQYLDSSAHTVISINSTEPNSTLNGTEMSDDVIIVDEANHSVQRTLSPFSPPPKSSQPNCSSIVQSATDPQSAAVNGSALKRLTDFFDRIPEASNDTVVDDVSLPPSADTLEDDQGNDSDAEIDNDVIENSLEESVSIYKSRYETPVKQMYAKVGSPRVPSIKKQSSMPSIGQSPLKIQSSNSMSALLEKISISAKIKVDIVIRTTESDTSSVTAEDEEKTEEESEDQIKRENISAEQEEDSGTPNDNEEGDPVDQSREAREVNIKENEPRSDNHPLDVTDPNTPIKNERGTLVRKPTSQEIANMDTEIDSINTKLECSAERAQRQPVPLAEMDTEANTPAVVGEGEPEKEEEAVAGIELDEASIAILNSVYGNEWQTPALLRSVKKASAERFQTPNKNNDSFQANMTDFQKFNASMRSQLESTRLDISKHTPLANRNTPIITLQKPQAVERVTTSPFFKPKTTPASSTVKQKPKRIPLKETPKYRRILQIVDTDTSDSEEEDKNGSDSSYKISNSSDSVSSSSASTPASVSTSPTHRRRNGKTKATAGPQRKKRSTTNPRIEISQIASSDSELDDTIFIDRNKMPPEASSSIIQLDAGPSKSFNQSVLPEKRKLFSNLDNGTPPTSSHDEGTDWDEEAVDVRKGEKNKDIQFPWLQYLTPINKRVDVVKRLEVPPPMKCGFLSSLDMKIKSTLADPVALTYREQYKTKKEELAQHLFQLYDAKVFEGALKEVPVTWNKKLLTTAGRCFNVGRVNDVRTATIELSEKVLTSADRLRCTLIHEMCHAAAWTVNGQKKGHGQYWRDWTVRAERALPELPKITVSHNYNIEYKYTYQCVQCKAKTQMHSKSKKAETIRCRFCFGDIEILLNKRTRSGDVVKTPVRAPSGFALYVKENYKRVKEPALKHADVMKVLSKNFSDLKMAQSEAAIVNDAGGGAGDSGTLH